MSTTSLKSSAHRSSNQVSFKPWFLTCVDEDVFGWKDGARLKLKNGQSAGRVKAISVLNANDNTVTVSFLCSSFAVQEHFLRTKEWVTKT